jgi:tetratricopeptide (TPR) repeat protein
LSEENGCGEIDGPRSKIDSAAIAGDVVQARDVSGGLHFHAAPEGQPAPRVLPRQLPADIGVFVNRQPELRALSRLTGSGPASPGPRTSTRSTTVVVVTGSAGVGKTALALHWAHRVRDRFPDGELYANLRGFDEGPPVSAEAVLGRFLRDLGVSPEGIPQDLDGRAALFRSIVANRRVLIVLDNAADIGQVRPLIPGGGGPFVVVTSRNQLAGLAIRDGARRIILDIFAESDAVALLRKVTRTGGRRDAPAELVELAELCARLPLALRVAAEHAISRPAMQLAELIADLRDDSMLWEALSTREGTHGEAVRTVFAWSYRDLSPEAAQVFRALGLHGGPDIGLPAVAAACAIPMQAARRALDILIGAFLVEAPRPGRYQLHDLLRAYALDQARTIDSEAERREIVGRTVSWYIATASRACTILFAAESVRAGASSLLDADPIDFHSTTDALEWLEAESRNLIAAARSAAGAGLAHLAWELALVLGVFHSHHLTFDDWAVHSEIAVSAAEEMADSSALAAALDNRGSFFFRRGLLQDAKADHARALTIRQAMDDREGVLRSLNALGLIGLRTRELAEAASYFSRTAAMASGADNAWLASIARMNLAEAHLESGHAAQASEIVTELPQLFNELGERAYQGNALWLTSWTLRLAGDPSASLGAIDAALQIAEEAGNRAWEAHWLAEAARVHLALSDTDEAMRCCRMAASLQRQIGDHGREATALDITGEVFLAMGNAADACAFHREAARMHRQLGDRWHEALATIHLADAETALGQRQASREDAAHALALLRDFADERATALRAGLEERLERRSSSGAAFCF